MTIMKLIACDLDDTLAITKQPIDAEMATIIEKVTEVADLCIITGGTFEQIKSNVLDKLPPLPALLNRIHCMPMSGSVYLRFSEGQWQTIYEALLPDNERERIASILEDTARHLGYWDENNNDLIQDRISQVTYSALGQNASPHDKYAWDPTKEKRLKMHELVSEKLPEYEVMINGKTSIDVLRPGINKAYGITELLEHTGYLAEETVFLGDSMYPGGNDYPVISTGVRTVTVVDPTETKQKLNSLLNSKMML